MYASDGRYVHPSFIALFLFSHSIASLSMYLLFLICG